MHEMSIAEGIIEIVERTAGRSGVTRVKEYLPFFIYPGQ